MKRFLLISSLALAAGCSNLNHDWSFAERKPQSVYEFVDYIPKLNERVNSSEYLNLNTCTSFIKKYTSYVYTKESEYYFPKNEAEKEFFLQKGEESLKGLFQLRLGLREFIKNNQSEINRECLEEIRNAIRYTRFAEDSLAEWLFNHAAEKSKVPSKLFTGGTPHTLINPKYDNVEFKAGDLLLVRGQSFVSAMIARIGDGDVQFSHLGMIGQDAKGKLYMVEALIEPGAIYTPLEDYLKLEEARIVLLRQEDEELAKKSARKIFDYVYAQKSQGKVVPYDFAMLDNEHSQLFCSEVVRYAYKMGSDNQFQVPMFRTSFSKLADTQFFKGMGIKSREAFAPADIELDPRFEVIAEFRTIPKLRKLRMMDSVLTSIYSWIENEKYEFKFNISTKFMSNTAWVARKLGFMKAKIQYHMPQSTIETVLKFESLTGPLSENLSAIEKDYFDQNGHSLTFKELLQINEEFRLKDCEAFNINQNGMHQEGFVPVEVKFHNEFRGKNTGGCELKKE